MQAQVDGVQLYYQTVGDGRTLAFAHSLGMDHSLWAAQERDFADCYRVLTFDARGHGASDKPPGPYSVEQFGEDFYGVLRAAGVERAVVIGLSMGGMAAQALAAAHPEAVEALVLADTTCWYGETAAQDWEPRARAAEEKGLASLLDFQLTRWFADRTRAERPDLVEQARRVFLANDVAAYAASCRALGAMDLRRKTDTIRCPTLVLVGAEDYATPPAMAEDLHRRIPGSELVVLPGVRHLSAVEAPEVVDAHITRLLGRLPQ
ncbi:MAG TPA: alpha/beta fold hydrolase [Chloroflexota bacterium]|nr:alpha/beta fold hydrolase [Chloroflexota bacterium]